MAKYNFCHGWTISPNGFSESECKRRDNCMYYMEDFYRKHGNHLQDFEEMFPLEPCQFYVERETAKVEKVIDEDDLFSKLTDY